MFDPDTVVTVVKYDLGVDWTTVLGAFAIAWVVTTFFKALGGKYDNS